MLRRFEIYSVAANVPPEALQAMATAMRDCGSYIPELLHSAASSARSDTALNFVWEHAYASPESYRRYMVHPYHAAILDRYLLNDSPERIVTDNDLGLGLAGYRCDAPDFLLPAGAARRVVALRLKPGAADRFAEIAEAEARRAGMIVSVFADNFFASRWFDGETQTAPEPPFTHLWEQGFASLDTALAHDAGWQAGAGAMVERSVELLYAIEPGKDYAASGG
jgi:hypothetical protein